MTKILKPKRTLTSVAVVGLLATSAAYAGGFSLYTEGSAAAQGNFAAGIAAEAADASTGWYNPAGLALIHKQQAVFSGVGIFPGASITGSSTFTTLPPLPASLTQTFSGLEGADNAFVPAFHYALPLTENTTFALSVVSPFGLSTDWDITSPVRYQATLSELITINVSPEIGMKLTENVAVGAGLDMQYARVKFNTMIGLPTFFEASGLNPSMVDTLSYNNGNSMGVGFHVGVMGLFNDNHTRLGLNYQSQMNHVFHGQSRLVGKLASPDLILGLPESVDAASANAVFKSQSLYSNPIVLPDVLTLSAYHDLNDSIALLGSVVYTGWSTFNTIELNNLAAPAISPPFLAVDQVRINNSTQENYSDAWRASVGVNYRVNPQWMLRVGGGYDATPTNDEFRDVRLPDGNRWALAVGAHYQMRPSVGFDVGYTHLFVPDNPTINRTEAIGATASFNVNATAKSNVNLVGAQLVWSIDKEIEAPSK